MLRAGRQGAGTRLLLTVAWSATTAPTSVLNAAAGSNRLMAMALKMAFGQWELRITHLTLLECRLHFHGHRPTVAGSGGHRVRGVCDRGPDDRQEQVTCHAGCAPRSPLVTFHPRPFPTPRALYLAPSSFVPYPLQQASKSGVLR